MSTIFICHNYLDESFASMSFHLANFLAENGNKVLFISKYPYFNHPKTIQQRKGELILCSWPSKTKSTSPKDFIWFAGLYKKHLPQVIIGHHNGSITSFIAGKLLSLGKVKTLEYYHTCTDQYIADKNGLNLRLRIFLLRRHFFFHLFCDQVICPSMYAKNDLESYFNYNKGINILNPLPDRYKGETIKKEPGNILISYIGRLDPTKNVPEMVRAFEIHLEKYPDSKIRLRIAGSGILEKEIQKLVDKNPKVEFVGFLQYEKVDLYMAESHFVIIPSKFDNLPTVSLESLMNATPILISQTSGTSYYLEHGKDSFIFEKDIESMVNIFKKVENCSPAEIETMSKNARGSFERLFNFENYFKEIQKVMSKIQPVFNSGRIELKA